MSATQYWQGRLVAKNPIYSEALRIERISFKPNADVNNTWPRAISRKTLYDDYVVWHEQVYLAPYKKSQNFIDNPENMPRAYDELGFYSAVAPWLYIVGKKEQVRVYAVPASLHYKGEWYDGKANRYFIRLCAWEAHVAAFELATNIDIGVIRTDAYFLDRQKVINDAATEMRNRIKANKDQMDRSMTK